MQIHEITLREAGLEPLDPKKIMATARPTPQAQPVKTNTTVKPQTPITPGPNVFGQIAQQLAPQTPAGPTTSSTGGTTTPTSQGLTHTASLDNPNPRSTPPSQQQLWDREYSKLKNQFPGLLSQQYQQAMLQRTGTARPVGPAQVATPRVAPQQPAATPRPAPAAKAPTPRPAPAANAAATTAPTQYPPITLGTGPKAQVFVNKGRGYVDSKTNKPMPPAIVKSMGLQ